MTGPVETWLPYHQGLWATQWGPFANRRSPGWATALTSPTTQPVSYAISTPLHCSISLIAST
jgi:hypothetical protein